MAETPKVWVYRWQRYSIDTDHNKVSGRYATLNAIVAVGGVMIPDTGIEVDPGELGSEIEGMTRVGYQPRRHGGFQRQVTD